MIGNTKTKIIQREPLLRSYLSLFDEVLKTPSRNLVVTGYGFRDPHINDVIADAIRNSGLRLYVICPMQPGEFNDMLTSAAGPFCPKGHQIWNGLCGYYPASVRDLFHHQTGELTLLGQTLFRNLGLP